jgi:hypothetical protein
VLTRVQDIKYSSTHALGWALQWVTYALALQIPLHSTSGCGHVGSVAIVGGGATGASVAVSTVGARVGVFDGDMVVVVSGNTLVVDIVVPTAVVE